MDKQRVAVYKCADSAYDFNHEPIFSVDSNFVFDFYWLSISGKQRSRIWQARRFASPSSLSRKNYNRYCKMFGHEIFTEYRYSLYVDGNVKVLSGLEGVVRSFIESRKDIMLFNHGIRNSIAQEIETCVMSNKIPADELHIARKQLEAYQQDGFVDGRGLYCGTVIGCNHQSERIPSAMMMWWDQYLRFAKRDQFSLPYIVWKNKLDVYSPGFDMHSENDCLKVMKHKPKNKLKAFRKWVKMRLHLVS